MPLLLLALLFLTVPLAELYVILKVGDSIGPLATIAILAADSLVGAVLLKTQGRAVWRRFQTAIEQRTVPHRELIDGVLVIFGGAFLITPGFITDFFGLLFLLPPTRAVFRAAILRLVARRIGAAALSGAGLSRAAERSRRRSEARGSTLADATPPGPSEAPPTAEHEVVEGVEWEEPGTAAEIERAARRR